MKTRKIRPEDVVDVALQFSDREGAIETLACKMDALEKLVVVLVAQFTAQQQMSMFEALTGGSNRKYERDGDVVLTVGMDAAR